jgi:hypothetical protein
MSLMSSDSWPTSTVRPFRFASFRVVEHGSAPAARDVTPREITEGGVLDELVRLRATLTNAAPDSLALAAGDLAFFATLDAGGLEPLALTPGSELEVTGVGIVTLRDGPAGCGTCC